MDPLLIRPGFSLPLEELDYSYTASSGPGGQKVNKTATKVRLKWKPRLSEAARKSLSPQELERLHSRSVKDIAEDGSVQVRSDRFRTREANVRECNRKLAEKVRAWLKKPRKRIPSSPTRASKERRLKEKKRVSKIKKDRGKKSWD